MYDMTPEQEDEFIAQINNRLAVFQQQQEELNRDTTRMIYINLQRLLNDAAEHGWSNELSGQLVYAYLMLAEIITQEPNDEERELVQQAAQHYDMIDKVCSNQNPEKLGDPTVILGAHTAVIPASSIPPDSPFHLAVAVDDALRTLRESYPLEKYRLIVIRGERGTITLRVDTTVPTHDPTRIMVDQYPGQENTLPAMIPASSLVDTVAPLLKSIT